MQIPEQERRYRDASAYLDRAMKARRETWLFRSPIVAYWRQTRRKVIKADKSLDVFRGTALLYLFWAATGLLLPFAALTTFGMWVQYRLQRLFRTWHYDFLTFDLEWAQYGVKEEIVGQAFRVRPVFAEVNDDML